MNRFVTLIRKDLADYRGALVWTPFVVAVIVLGLSLIAVLMGRFESGLDFGERSAPSVVVESGPGDTATLPAPANPGQASGLVIDRDDGQGVFVETDSNGEPRLRVMGEEVGANGVVDPEDQPRLRVAAAVVTAVGAMLPVGIAAVVIIFTLLGALYDERKDRSILFWKSMPTSDLETVLSKVLTIGGIGLGAALAAGAVIHIGLNLITFTRFAGSGLGWIGIDTLAAMVQVWALFGCVVVVYLLWVMPVYAWLLFASAASPKAPILLGLVPFALGPIAAHVVGLYSDWMMEPASRLTGEPMWALFSRIEDPGDSIQNGQLDFGPLFQSLAASFAQPGLWIGLVVAAALIYATAEVRRRKAL